MKTILLPIFHGHIARNVLLTDTFRLLAGRSDLHLVILAYNFKQAYYQKTFGRPNVKIVGLAETDLRLGCWEPVFKSLFSFFADSPRHIQVFQEILDKDGNYPAYVLRRMATALIGNSPVLRNLVRWLYHRLVPAKAFFLQLLERYQPGLVFLPDMTFHVDNYLLRAARTRGISSIGMLRSWDALTSNKGTIRIKPDQLLVHNEFMKKMAVKYGDMKPAHITVTGMPQLDIYVQNPPTERSAFFRKLGLDPAKRIILFALTGPRTAGINQDIISIITEAIVDGRLPSDLQLLVRMHPNSNPESFTVGKGVVFHRPAGVEFSAGRLADIEFTDQWLQELLDSLYYSAVTINAQSTMSVDAAAFDKPIINLAFDGRENLPYTRSVRRLYHSEHYAPILKSGGVRVAYNESELLDWLKRYLTDPALDRNGRQRIITEQTGQLDGQAGRRTADYIIKFLKVNIDN